jgi:hypothetical protein
MGRHAADGTVKRLARRAGIAKRISPHSLRQSFITAALDAGVPLLDVQEPASQPIREPPGAMTGVGRSLDRHATYIVAAFLAGASRCVNPLSIPSRTNACSCRSPSVRRMPQTPDDGVADVAIDERAWHRSSHLAGGSWGEQVMGRRAAGDRHRRGTTVSTIRTGTGAGPACGTLRWSDEGVFHRVALRG